jgi:hypothetical protein
MAPKNESIMSKYLQIPYLCFFLLLSVWAIRQPHYTWDVLGYVGCAVDSTDAKVIQRAALDAIRNATSDEDIRVDNPYRADVAANPYHFAEQLPFYSIKPVYVAFIKVLHRTGMPFQKSAVAISAASDFLLAVLLWQWLAPYLSSWSLAAACTLIMLSPNILVLSRWATPDCLATLVAAVAFYLILERRSYFMGSAFLVLNVWVRTDALVLAGIVFAVLLMSRKLDIAEFAALSLLALGSYFTINHFAGNYGWPTLFYNSFLGGVTAPGEMIIHISRSAYVHQVVRGAFLWLITGSFALYLLLGGLAISLNRSSMYSLMCGAVLAARALSYLLYPNGDERYTAVLFVLIPVALVVGVSSKISERSVSSQSPSGLHAAYDTALQFMDPYFRQKS